jgi:hypothetical protein
MAIPPAGPLHSRSSIPLVFVLRVEYNGNKGERPVIDTGEFALIWLLLNRQKVLMAGLRRVDKLKSKAARAPRRLR